MRRKREFVDYLRDILDSIEKVGRFTEGMDFEHFSSDEKTVYAVIRALEIIGEAAKKVPRPVQRRHPDIPWREMSGIRDKLVHEYFGVNLRVVWSTVTQDLPALKPLIEQMVQESVKENQSDVS